MHLMSCPSIVFRKPSMHKCPFVCQHMKCRHSDEEVPFGLIIAETLGVEGVGVEVWGCLVSFIVGGDWIEPTISSTGVSTGGLAISVLGRVS